MRNNFKYSSIIKLLRPKQWIKNFFVLAALVFSGNIFNNTLLIKNIFTFLLFCFASSCVYILNDIVDVEKDRQHPQKKFRPIASGEISLSAAIYLGVFIFCIVSFLAYILNFNVFLIILLYIIINIFYSFKLKHVVLLDVMVIMIGFVLRVEGGSFVTMVQLSPWLLLCTILLSLFIAINKRKSEIITLDRNKGAHRKILEEYTPELLDKMLSIVTPCILIAYCLYTFNSVQSRGMMITIPFVLYGIFRYEYLMGKSNIGGKPEDIFFKDKPFLINIILWAFSVIIIVYLKL